MHLHAPNAANSAGELGIEREGNPAIPEIQSGIRDRVFRAVMEGNGTLPDEWRRTDDLRAAPSGDIEAVKEGAMKGREVVLEERRLIEMLADAFRDMRTHPERIPGPDGEDKDAFRRDLPSLIRLLEGPRDQLFRSGLDIEAYARDLQSHLARIQEALEGTSISAFTKNIVRMEVRFALDVLEDARKRPVLAHRARGFGKDEASAENLRRAAEEHAAEVEFDIRMSSDHQPMIHHNATLGASAGRPEGMKNLTCAALKELPLRNGSHITDLRGFFEMLRETGNEVTKVNIDIKDFDDSMLDAILALVREYRMEHRVAIVSWFPQALQYLYEKDPTLSYSLSYYPFVRGLSRWLINRIQSVYGNPAARIPGINLLASFVARARVRSMEEGNPKVQGLGSELITDSIALNPNVHWTEIKSIAGKRGESLVGRHTFAGGPAPEPASAMGRVLRNGSVNVMAMEEMLVSTINRLPLPAKMRGWILNFFRRKEAILAFAQECAKLGIKVNLFDLKDPKSLNAHFDTFEDAGLQAGVVYSSNANLVPRIRIPTEL